MDTGKGPPPELLQLTTLPGFEGGPWGYFHWTPNEQAILTVERKNNFSKAGGHKRFTQVNSHGCVVNLALAARKEATCKQASWLCQNVLFHHTEI